jgi:hypothetical protein
MRYIGGSIKIPHTLFSIISVGGVIDTPIRSLRALDALACIQGNMKFRRAVSSLVLLSSTVTLEPQDPRAHGPSAQRPSRSNP